MPQPGAPGKPAAGLRASQRVRLTGRAEFSSFAGMRYRFALITGATSGIGEALARALPEKTGLLLTGRDGERLAALEAELGSADRQVETLVADLAEDPGRDAVIAAAEELSIDLLINNAGLGQIGQVLEIPAGREREMAEVNVVAPVVLTRALLPGMLTRAKSERRRAGLIVVASIVAFQPAPMMATYAASKAFDLHYAEALASELAGQPIDVLALCPGGTRTRFGERAGIHAQRSSGWDSPERVAREALAALGQRSVHVVGGRNRLVTTVPRFLPRRTVAAIFRRALAGMGEA